MNVLFNHFAAPSACQNNGGCSQLCVLRPNGRTCICQAGMITENGTNCKFPTFLPSR